jgi:hypothetical protein
MRKDVDLARAGRTVLDMSIRACIEILGITQVEAARIYGVNPRTMRRWLACGQAPPGWRRILAAHVRTWQPPEHTERMRQLAPEVVEAWDDERREREREARWKAKWK